MATSSSDVGEAGDISEESNTQRWKRMAEESKQTKSSYRSMAHIIPSSIICESLFSDAKHIMTDTRRHMDPSTLEMFLILKYNKDLWNARTIDMIINRDEAPISGQKRVQSDDEDDEDVSLIESDISA